MKEIVMNLCDEPMSAKIAGALGKGLVAGLIGTAAITVSQQIEMNKTGREPSKTPLLAAQSVLGFNPKDDESADKLNNVVHIVYGTSLGILRSILNLLGIRGILATLIHIAAIQGLAMYILPRLKVSPPVSQWDKKTIKIELIHHTVYGIFSGFFFDRMNRCVKIKD